MSGLRARAIRGVAWTAAQRWTVRAAGLITFVVLSRLLTPGDVGLVALALAVTGAVAALVDLGLSDYLVRSDDEDATTTSTVFWLQAGLSVIIAAIVVVLAEPLAALLGQSRLTPVLQVSAALLPVYACAVVPTALLHRGMRFQSLAVRDIAATLAGAVAGITAAVMGAGVWALVLQSAVHAVTTLATVLLATRWRPSLAFSTGAVRRARRFVGAMTGVQILQALRDRADHFVIGALLGTEALGLWLVAARLVGIVTEMSASTLETVALPVFSRVQGDALAFRRVHSIAASYTALLLVPALLVLGFLSPALVPTLFGPQWEQAVVLAQILCLSYAIFGLTYLNRPSLIAHGRVGVEFALTATGAGLHVALVTVAAASGLRTVAWAMVVEAVLLVLVGSAALRRALRLVPPVPRRTLLVVVGGLCAALVGVGVQNLAALGTAAGAALATLAALGAFGLWMLVTDAALVREAGQDARRLQVARR